MKAGKNIVSVILCAVMLLSLPMSAFAGYDIGADSVDVDCSGNPLITQEQLKSMSYPFQYRCVQGYSRQPEAERGYCFISVSGAAGGRNDAGFGKDQTHNPKISSKMENGAGGLFASPGGGKIGANSNKSGFSVDLGSDTGGIAGASFPVLHLSGQNPPNPLNGQKSTVLAKYQDSGNHKSAEINEHYLSYGMDGNKMGGGTSSTIFLDYSAVLMISSSQIPGNYFTQSNAVATLPENPLDQHNLVFYGETGSEIQKVQGSAQTNFIASSDNAEPYVSEADGSNDRETLEIAVEQHCAKYEYTQTLQEQDFATKCNNLVTAINPFGQSKSCDTVASCKEAGYKESDIVKVLGILDQCKEKGVGIPKSFNLSQVLTGGYSSYEPTYDSSKKCVEEILEPVLYQDPQNAGYVFGGNSRPASLSLGSDVAGIDKIRVKSTWYQYLPMSWADTLQWGSWSGTITIGKFCASFGQENRPCGCKDSEHNRCGTGKSCLDVAELKIKPVYWKSAGGGKNVSNYLGSVTNNETPFVNDETGQWVSAKAVVYGDAQVTDKSNNKIQQKVADVPADPKTNPETSNPSVPGKSSGSGTGSGTTTGTSAENGNGFEHPTIKTMINGKETDITISDAVELWAQNKFEQSVENYVAAVENREPTQVVVPGAVGMSTILPTTIISAAASASDLIEVYQKYREYSNHD